MDVLLRETICSYSYFSKLIMTCQHVMCWLVGQAGCQTSRCWLEQSGLKLFKKEDLPPIDT